MKNHSEKPYTHAGGIVYKIENGNALYLLVRPKKNQREWVLPKGHIEAGETDIQAAVREVEEETGVVTREVAFAGHTEFDSGKEHVRAAFYLMEFLRMGVAQEVRETRWVRYVDAIEMITHESNRELLKLAELKRS